MPKGWFETERGEKKPSVSLKFVLLLPNFRREPESVTTFGEILRHLECQPDTKQFVCLDQLLLLLGFS